MPLELVPTKVNHLKEWRRDDCGDYTILIDRRKDGISLVSGKIIRCPVTEKWNYSWRTKQRWLLLVDAREFGFYGTLRAAAERFAKDCVPKAPIGDDDGDEFYCWHQVPIGKGPYCTDCGGLIKTDVK